jgi:UPF0716 protein FxsA
MGKIFLLFVGITLLEIYLLVKVGTYVGALPVVAIVVGTALAGIGLAKHQGMAAIRNIRDDVREGRFPGGSILDGALVVAGGFLLVLPGFCADILGLILIFPPTRYLGKLLFRLILARMVQKRGGRTIVVYRS